MKIKQISAVFLACTLALGMTACGKDKKNAAEATTEAENGNEAAIVADDVELPGDFENMFYPMKALALENYCLGYPYYVQFADGSSRDSFWYSCALTAKLLNEEEGDTFEVEGENMDQIVSALYASYQEGNLEFPEIRDGVAYAKYSDDGSRYIFSNKASDYVPDDTELEQYSLTITSCEDSGNGYLIKAELEDTNFGSTLGRFEYEVEGTKYSNGSGNPFSYSIVSMYDTNSSSGVSSEEETSETDTDTTMDSTDDTTESSENTENTTGEDSEQTEETSEAQNSSGEITQEEALALAQATYGSSASYTYQKMEYLDAYPYYRFSVQSEDLSISYVLVSVSGQDVVGANQNSDGSWTFDQ